MNLVNQHIIITGGSSGIGLAMAKLFASRGANITIIARRLANLQQAQRDIENNLINSDQVVLAIAADVRDQLSLTEAINRAIARIGQPDVLITSAGIAHPGYFHELPVTVFEETMQVNYYGTLYAIKAVLPSMIKRGKGQIVLISSGAGLIGIYGYTTYSPSKFAVRGLAESLRGELRPHGINVSIVYPPDTDTPQLEQENLTKPPASKLITGSAKILKAETVAYAIMQGIEKRQFAITPGLEMTLLQKFHSLLFPFLQSHFDKIVDQFHHTQ